MAPRRVPMAKKKAILREYLADNHGETQTQFCRRLGLGESMFSKWLRDRDDILATADGRVYRDTNRAVRDQKRVLRESVEAAAGRGEDLRVLDVMRMAKRLAPAIFRTVSTYNGRYMMCQRLLHEFLPQTMPRIGRHSTRERFPGERPSPDSDQEHDQRDNQVAIGVNLIAEGSRCRSSPQSASNNAVGSDDSRAAGEEESDDVYYWSYQGEEPYVSEDDNMSVDHQNSKVDSGTEIDSDEEDGSDCESSEKARNFESSRDGSEGVGEIESDGEGDARV